MSTKPKQQPPTPAQQAMWHGLQSVFQAAIISVCVGCGQYLVTGNISANGLLTVLCASFAGAGSMIYKSVAANPALAQAALDTAQEALGKVEQIAPWLAKDLSTIQNTQRPAPQPITFPPAQQKPAQAQQQSGGGGVPPADYYTRGYSVVPRASIADMSTQGYVPSVNPNQSMLANIPSALANPVQQAPQQQFTGNNQVPPAMSFLQERPTPQQGG